MTSPTWSKVTTCTRSPILSCEASTGPLVHSFYALLAKRSSVSFNFRRLLSKERFISPTLASLFMRRSSLPTSSAVRRASLAYPLLLPWPFDDLVLFSRRACRRFLSPLPGGGRKCSHQLGLAVLSAFFLSLSMVSRTLKFYISFSRNMEALSMIFSDSPSFRDISKRLTCRVCRL